MLSEMHSIFLQNVVKQIIIQKCILYIAEKGEKLN